MARGDKDGVASAGALTCQVVVHGLHLALGPDEGLVDDALLLLLQHQQLGVQLPVSAGHLAIVQRHLRATSPLDGRFFICTLGARRQINAARLTEQ